jgi:hypothetical protein
VVLVFCIANFLRGEFVVTPHSEIVAVLPIWVLVVKADLVRPDKGGVCVPVSEDLQRAEVVSQQVKTYLDGLENATHRVVQTGNFVASIAVAAIFRKYAVEKAGPTFATVSPFARRGIEENDEIEYGAYVRQVTSHLNAQIGCDVLIAVLGREVINQLVNNRLDVRVPHPRFALKGGEACVISRDGLYREVREPPPATAAAAP